MRHAPQVPVPVMRAAVRRLDGLWHVAHASAGQVTAATAATTTFGTALAERLAGGRSGAA